MVVCVVLVCGRLNCLGCVCLSWVLVLGCASRFVCAWISWFGFAFAEFAADLGAGVSGSARRALDAAKGPTFAAALVIDGRYLCAGHRRERIGTGRVGGATAGVRVCAPA